MCNSSSSSKNVKILLSQIISANLLHWVHVKGPMPDTLRASEPGGPHIHSALCLHAPRLHWVTVPFYYINYGTCWHTGSVVVLLSACIINNKYVIRLARDTDLGVLIFSSHSSVSHIAQSPGVHSSPRDFFKNPSSRTLVVRLFRPFSFQMQQLS